ncbi:unnamed protein product [Haemonchus placei]|uniref:Methyltransferase n=1 Tax=Haemonchus placei TaxID=6290 RepID=A0A0N4W3D0_HAEPC|nr:unnamed protein product [Haemonchus placei]
MTVVQHPLQEELQKSTLQNSPRCGMLGAPEVLTVGSNFMHLINGKKAIDIGTFTGASALAWAIAAGEGGQVYTLDINHDNFKKYGVPVISKDQNIFKRIVPVEGPALAWLGELESLVPLFRQFILVKLILALVIPCIPLFYTIVSTL